MDFRKLLTRSLSGLIYCLIIVLAIYMGPLGVAVLAALLSSLACIEFAKISHDSGSKYHIPLITDITSCILLSFTPFSPILALGWLTVMIVRFVEQLYIKEKDPVRDLAHSVLVQGWIAVPLFLMSLIAELWQPMIILAIFLFIWINDTGAYLIGSIFGKHRLFERISPKNPGKDSLVVWLSISASRSYASFSENISSVCRKQMSGYGLDLPLSLLCSALGVISLNQ